MKIKYIFTIIFSLIIHERTIAQVSISKPLLSNKYQVKTIDKLPTFNMPKLNNDSLSLKYNGKNYRKKMGKFINIEVPVSIGLNDGLWEKVTNDELIFNLGHRSVNILTDFHSSIYILLHRFHVHLAPNTL